MLARFIVPVVICIVATLGMWLVIEKTRPVFRTTEIEQEGRSKGGFTDEMGKEYRYETLKCDMVSFGIWGAILAGMSGLIGNPLGKSRFLGMGVGVVLGAGAGVLGAYLGQMHEAMMEYQGASSTYWMIRWAAIMLPTAVVASVAAALSGSMSRQFVECFVGSILGLAIGVIAFSLLHGVATPLEKSSYIYPAWSSTRILAMLSINLGVFAMILIQAGRVQLKGAQEPVGGAVVEAKGA